jgi:hypothetical protein
MVLPSIAFAGYETGLGIITAVSAISGIIEARRSHTGETIGVPQ